MNQRLAHIEHKKKQLDSYRPLPKELISNLNEWFKIECTYTSNALEGNTLTSSETALIVEKGITIGGKTIKEHLEAINLAQAFDYIVELARAHKNDISLSTIRDMHQLILRRIDDDNAGKWRTINVKISGKDLVLPESVKIPERMEGFILWLHETREHPVIIAAQAHLQLVTIHPFVDGNGRTARLLMNLLLLQYGYPPVFIRPEMRKTYIDALYQAQKHHNVEPYYALIMDAVEQSLDIYLQQIAPH